MRTYSELIEIPDFLGRYEYLKLQAGVGDPTFGYDRYLNQGFYSSKEWRNIRHYVIARDTGNDLGVDGFPILDKVFIHHITPMTSGDIIHGRDMILDPENLITTSHNTHNAIHYGDASLLTIDLVERQPGDTKLW